MLDRKDPISDGTSGLPRSRSGRLVLFIVLGLLVFLGMVFAALPVLSLGPGAVLQHAVFPPLVVLVVVGSVFFIFPAMYLPSVIRNRRLKLLFPNAIVGTLILNSSDRHAIDSLRRGVPTTQRLRFTMTLTAEATAIRFWVGARHPELIAEVAWVRITDVSAVSYLMASRKRESLVFTLGGTEEPLDLSIVTRRWIGFAPARVGELDSMVDALRDLKAAR